MKKINKTVNFYFVLSDTSSLLYGNHKFWYATGNVLPGDTLEVISIPRTVPRSLLYLSDYIIACAHDQKPIYLKSRSHLVQTLISPEEMIYIKLASLPISD